MLSILPFFGSQKTNSQLKDIVQWDAGNWSLAIDFFDKHIDWSMVQNGLELGAHTGGLSLWLALKGKQVVCSDLDNPQSRAELLHRCHNLNHISYQAIDATDIPYQSYFDVIVFKSMIGGIGRNQQKHLQARAFLQIYQALKPGGYLLFAENLLGSFVHQYLRQHFVSWGDSWRYITLQECQEFLRPFKTYTLRTTGILGALGRSEFQRQWLARIDQSGLSACCPPNWHYLVYGVAQK